MLLGTLRFGKFDVTETQLSIIFLHLMSAIFGTEIWDYEVSNNDYSIFVGLNIYDKSFKVLRLIFFEIF